MEGKEGSRCEIFHCDSSPIVGKSDAMDAGSAVKWVRDGRILQDAGRKHRESIPFLFRFQFRVGILFLCPTLFHRHTYSPHQIEALSIVVRPTNTMLLFVHGSMGSLLSVVRFAPSSITIPCEYSQHPLLLRPGPNRGG